MGADAEHAARVALLPQDEILRRRKSWFTGLAGLASLDGGIEDGAGERLQRDVVAELTDSSDDARESFLAALAATRDAKGRVMEADLQVALDGLRGFKSATDANAGRIGRWLHRQVRSHLQHSRLRSCWDETAQRFRRSPRHYDRTPASTPPVRLSLSGNQKCWFGHACNAIWWKGVHYGG